MVPTLIDKERILVDKRAYIYVDPNKNDIVGMTDPKDSSLHMLKELLECLGIWLKLALMK